MAWCGVVEPRTLRECRIALGQSQAAFAAMLGVSLESYRTWDAGRRATPPKILARARALATHRDDHALLPLPVLALLIGVHVKTLRAGRAAAGDLRHQDDLSRRWCMNRNWPATILTQRLLTYRYRTTLARQGPSSDLGCCMRAAPRPFALLACALEGQCR